MVMILSCFFVLFHSVLKKCFLDARRAFFLFFFLCHISVKMHVHFLKAGPLPWASQAIHWAAHFLFCNGLLHPTECGEQRERECVCGRESVCCSGCVLQQRCVRAGQPSLQDQSLSMKSCTICKKVKVKKTKKKHLRQTVLFLLSQHLLSTDCFQWLTFFFSCGHFNIYYVFVFVYYR